MNPPTIFPIVTGIKFHMMKSIHETLAPSIIPAGIKYMLATQCSNPDATKAMIGNQMPKNLPIMAFDEKANRIATFTRRLQPMPFMKADQYPMAPTAM